MRFNVTNNPQRLPEKYSPARTGTPLTPKRGDGFSPRRQRQLALASLLLFLALFGGALVSPPRASSASPAPQPMSSPSPSPSPFASPTPWPTPPTSPQVDRSFGVDGRQIVFYPNPNPYGYSPRAMAWDTVVQTDGRIVVVGEATIGGTSSAFAAARLNPDGSFDSGFDGDGQTAFFLLSSNNKAYSVALQRDGKIVMAGTAYEGYGYNYDFGLARLNPDGSLDQTFGAGGKVTTDFGGDEEARAVLIQPDGKIVAVGFRINDHFALARYNPDGSLDQSFGAGGRVLTNFGEPRSLAYAAVLQPDGKILAAGDIAGGGNPSDFAIARYNPNGSLDLFFGFLGLVRTDFAPELGGQSFEQLGRSIVLQPDGKFIVGGWTGTSCWTCYPVTDTHTALARYNPNGSLDPTFSGNGLVVADLFPGFSDRADDIALQQNGKIITVSNAPGHLVPNGSHIDFLVARFLNNGDVDNSFGDAGRVRIDFGMFNPPDPPTYGSYFTGDSAQGVTIQPDGRIVAVGYVSYGRWRRDFGIARLFGDPVVGAPRNDIPPPAPPERDIPEPGPGVDHVDTPSEEP